jgi:site-specific DNA-methyltransferase (adenine-specific)/modification methylase
MTMPEPYYRDEASGIALYHGDCRDVLAGIDPATVALLLSDPPYGIGLDTANASRQRGRPVGGRDGRQSAFAPANDYPPIHGDDEPFDPTHLLRFRRLILFGANHYADRLPASPSWLVWDKVAGLQSKRVLGFCDNADAELIWTNLGGPVRILRLQWSGLMKGTERGEARVHPTQKPVALLRWLIEHFTKPSDLVLDPYAGSGSTLRAALDTGRRCVGVEISEDYCRRAVARLAQAVLPLEVPA